MMKSVLISINKPHTDNIFTTKKKRVEWRKKPLPLTTHYVYETKNKGGIGKVRGRFDVVQNIEINPLDYHLYSAFIEQGCVPIDALIEYANGGVIYGNVIENIEEYDKPKELSEFRKSGALNYDDWLYGLYNGTTESTYEKYLLPFTLTRPPQSWCYVEELG